MTERNALLADDELTDRPVLVTTIWKISSDDKRDLSGGKLLHGNLQWVRLAFGRHKYGCVHAEMPSNIGTRIVSLVAENTDGDSPKLASTPAHSGKGWG